jgi:hypothetical protein
VKKKSGEILLKVSLPTINEISGVPLLTLNGLQQYPRVGDSILVLCREGYIQHAIAIAVVSSDSTVDENQTALTSGKSKITLKNSSNDVSLGEILSQLSEMIEAIAAPGYILGPGVAPEPGKAAQIKASISILKSKIAALQK